MTSISGIKGLEAVGATAQNASIKADTIKNKMANPPSQEMTGASFADRLQESLNAVADAQNNAAQSVVDYETGKSEDLTKVMVDQQISSLGFQMTLNVRNKALSAYKEIMNMPV